MCSDWLAHDVRPQMFRCEVFLFFFWHFLNMFLDSGNLAGCKRGPQSLKNNNNLYTFFFLSLDNISHVLIRRDEQKLPFPKKTCEQTLVNDIMRNKSRCCPMSTAQKISGVGCNMQSYFHMIWIHGIFFNVR